MNIINCPKDTLPQPIYHYACTYTPEYIPYYCEKCPHKQNCGYYEEEEK